MQHVFTAFLEWYGAYGYPVLFLGVLLENAGVPVPGETAVLAAGFLASPVGGSRFQIGWVIALAFAAAVVGDNVGYWLGRRLARQRLLRGRRFLLLTPQALQTAEGYFARFGALAVFAARFVTGLRVAAGLAADTAGMHWPRFFAANAAGALLWAGSIGVLGYFFGRSWRVVHYWLGWGSWMILGGAVLVAGLWYLRKVVRRRAKNESP